MFGYLRFVLALLVATSHCGYYMGDFNQGVFSVVIFYILAGYVMSAKYLKYYSGAPKGIRGFYLDRALRIFPQYFFWLIAGLVYFWLSAKLQKYEGWDFISLLFKNVTIIPTSFWMIKGFPTFVGQAFSLGLELQFYLLLPLLLWKGKFPTGSRILTALCALLFIWVVAAPQPGLDRFIWSYYLLPPILPCFVMGILLYSGKGSSLSPPSGLPNRNFLWGLLIAFGLCLVLIHQQGLLAVDFGFEVCLGILVGTALLGFLSRLTFSGPLDALAGHASYGIYLSHTFWIWQMDHLYGAQGPGPRSLAELGSVLFLAVVSGLFGYLMLEKPIDRYRKKIATNYLRSL